MHLIDLDDDVLRHVCDHLLGLDALHLSLTAKRLYDLAIDRVGIAFGTRKRSTLLSFHASILHGTDRALICSKRWFYTRRRSNPRIKKTKSIRTASDPSLGNANPPGAPCSVWWTYSRTPAASAACRSSPFMLLCDVRRGLRPP